MGDGEVAWFSKGTGVYIFQYVFVGSRVALDWTTDAYAPSAHPFQKPVALMEWCVEKTAGTVFDPFMGSGTTGVACVNCGRPFIGVEIEEKFFDISVRRISKALATPKLNLEYQDARR